MALPIFFFFFTYQFSKSKACTIFFFISFVPPVCLSTLPNEFYKTFNKHTQPDAPRILEPHNQATMILIQISVEGSAPALSQSFARTKYTAIPQQPGSRGMHHLKLTVLWFPIAADRSPRYFNKDYMIQLMLTSLANTNKHSTLPRLSTSHPITTHTLYI